jgi:hypothetical protein
MLTWCFWEKTFNDPAVFWAMATFVLTAALVFVAWWELRDLARTSRADFIFRLKKDFFTEDARQLLFLVDEDLLQFEDCEIPYFTVRNANEPGLHGRFEELGVKGSTVSTYVVDDVLLGPFEDVGVFLTGKLITEKHAYEMFYTYLKSCSENAEIRKYIQSTRREPEDSDIYGGFDDLYKRLRKMEPKK